LTVTTTDFVAGTIAVNSDVTRYPGLHLFAVAVVYVTPVGAFPVNEATGGKLTVDTSRLQ